MSYGIERIRLQEAMTKELDMPDMPCRIWGVDGLKIEVEDLPKDAVVNKTFVFKAPDSNYLLNIMGHYEDGRGSFSREIDNFSTLEELKEKYPNLFEMEGALIAF